MSDISSRSTASREYAPIGRPNNARVQSSSSIRGFHGVGETKVGYGDLDTPGASRRPDVGRRSQSDDLRSGMASPVMPDIPSEYADRPATELRAGLVLKPFFIETSLLTTTSPYFDVLQHPIPTKLSGPFYFPDLDEYALALFVRWIYGGGLHGPQDFHSLQHYLCLYVIGARFQVESLRNNVMDLVRGYYRRENMTAPAFRIEYVYSNTAGPCPLREFLITSAAYRALSDGEGGGLGESVKGALKGGGDLAVDFAEALLRLSKNERVDVRKGDDCRWHEHDVTEKCSKALAPEPYENA